MIKLPPLLSMVLDNVHYISSALFSCQLKFMNFIDFYAVQVYHECMRKVIEGYMPFLKYRTYYRIVKGGVRTPIVLLHGGPGSTHNYFELLDSIADTGRDVIMYDQLGCGNSYVDHRPDLWNQDTWLDELEALRNHLKLQEVILLGQSWGGMLAIMYVLDRKPAGVKGLVLSSTLSSASLWSKEQHRNIAMMSPEDQQAIACAERSGNWNTPEAITAVDHFMKRHCADIQDDDPECLRREKKSGSESYLIGWGPNEFTPEGTLRNYEYTSCLHEIHVPTLIVSGTDDLCTPLVAKTMYDRIPDSRWELFAGARHMCFAEQNDHYIAILTNFLDDIG